MPRYSGGWKPIGSAPRDGSEFIVIDRLDKMHIVNWPEGLIMGRWRKYRTGLWYNSYNIPILPRLWHPLVALPKLIRENKNETDCKKSKTPKSTGGVARGDDTRAASAADS
jgi:hypothetical protein